MVKCELCSREFNNNYGLTRHLVSKHNEISTRDYFEKYVPAKLCKCGCGQFTLIKQGSERADYINGHNLAVINEAKKGKPRSKEVKEKIRLGNLGQKRSKKTRDKISKAQSKIWTDEKKEEASNRVEGENHPNWRGGRAREGMYHGNSKEMIDKCRQRDKNICQMCGKTKDENKRNMDVHHIDPYLDSKDNSLDNLICLCRKCHPIADRNNLSREEILNFNKKEE